MPIVYRTLCSWVTESVCLYFTDTESQGQLCSQLKRIAGVFMQHTLSTSATGILCHPVPSFKHRSSRVAWTRAEMCACV